MKRTYLNSTSGFSRYKLIAALSEVDADLELIQWFTLYSLERLLNAMLFSISNTGLNPKCKHPTQPNYTGKPIEFFKASSTPESKKVSLDWLLKIAYFIITNKKLENVNQPEIRNALIAKMKKIRESSRMFETLQKLLEKRKAEESISRPAKRQRTSIPSPSLSGTSFTDDMVKDLVEFAIKNKDHTCRIKLKNGQFGKVGLLSLVEKIPELPVLTELHLSIQTELSLSDILEVMGKLRSQSLDLIHFERPTGLGEGDKIILNAWITARRQMGFLKESCQVTFPPP